MTARDNLEPVEPVEPAGPSTAPATPPEPAEPPAEQAPAEELEGKPGGNAEAAKYRRQLREAEAERDQLATTLEAQRRSLIDQIITDVHRVKPAAIWASGVAVDDLLDEAGVVDLEKLASAVGTAQHEFGLAGDYPLGNIVPGAGHSPTTPMPTNTWSDQFKPKR